MGWPASNLVELIIRRGDPSWEANIATWMAEFLLLEVTLFAFVSSVSIEMLLNEKEWEKDTFFRYVK